MFHIIMEIFSKYFLDKALIVLDLLLKFSFEFCRSLKRGLIKFQPVNLYKQFFPLLVTNYSPAHHWHSHSTVYMYIYVYGECTHY